MYIISVENPSWHSFMQVAAFPCTPWKWVIWEDLRCSAKSLRFHWGGSRPSRPFKQSRVSSLPGNSTRNKNIYFFHNSRGFFFTKWFGLTFRGPLVVEIRRGLRWEAPRLRDQDDSRGVFLPQCFAVLMLLTEEPVVFFLFGVGVWTWILEIYMKYIDWSLRIKNIQVTKQEAFCWILYGSSNVPWWYWVQVVKSWRSLKVKHLP